MKLGKFHGLNITIGNDKVIINMFNEGVKQSSFSFDSQFKEMEGLYRRVGLALQHLTSDHFNPACEDPKPASFYRVLYKPISDEVCMGLKFSHAKGHKCKFTTDPLGTGEVLCSWC